MERINAQTRHRYPFRCHSHCCFHPGVRDRYGSGSWRSNRSGSRGRGWRPRRSCSRGGGGRRRRACRYRTKPQRSGGRATASSDDRKRWLCHENKAEDERIRRHQNKTEDGVLSRRSAARGDEATFLALARPNRRSSRARIHYRGASKGVPSQMAPSALCSMGGIAEPGPVEAGRLPR